MNEVKNIQRCIMIIFLLSLTTSCSTISGERQEIIEWATDITNIEKRLEYEFDYYDPLIKSITNRPPTDKELSELNDFSNQITKIYNDASTLYVPKDARTTHSLFLNSYAYTADMARYYYLAIKMNDLEYFDKSVKASQEANRIGSEAYYSFEDLLDEYSISCSEIDHCE